MSHNQAVGATHDEPKIEGLQPGAKLLRGQYEILRFISNGGFGITYLARDSLEREVVIKECYPGALCRRNGDTVEPVEPGYKDDLRAIIDLFILEARNHARLVHPNIVDVHQVFEDNETAYIAMDFIRGCDLLDYVEDAKNKAGPDFIIQVTEKMLSAVSFIHQSGMLHRDISPDNILIDENGDPVLIDFGAAREQAAHQSAALMTLRVIKDGYSPHEFYVRGAEQGPSSDLYVLAATLYHAISGERPIDGQTRLNAFNNSQKDPYTPLAGRFEGYPEGFLEAIDKAMEVHATDRLQTALDWLRMFRGPGVMFDSFDYRPVSVIVAMDQKDEEEEKARIKAESENAEAVVTALLAGNTDIALGNEDKSEDGLATFTSKEETPVAVDTVVKSGSGGAGKVVAGVAVIAALAAGGFFLMSNEETPVEDTASTQTPLVTDTVEETAVVETPEQEPVAQEQEPVEQAATAEVEPAPAQAEPTQAEVETTPEPVEQAQQDPILTDEEEAATAETAETVSAEPTPIVPAEPVELAEQQVAFSHWDVEIPFQTSRRRASTGNVIAVTGVDQDMDPAIVGEWVKRGTTIFTLNSKPVQADMTFAAQVMNDLTVDPDGYIRVSARYRTLGETRPQNGLLALPAMRVLGLENGYVFTIKNEDGAAWQSVLTSVPPEATGGLQKGDVLIAETSSGTRIDGSDSLEALLAKLVSENQPQARFSVLRRGTETNAEMPLAQE
ncbi:serine/threonine protein kinase [Ruegeria atlantica]|uniref:serine/threonine protein kinase n=1 Tax=Ruegeria atlantica TaxID=81569 RepID=UPI001480EC7A|nr:serine/threonine-protein kinase [Ruegeria atlantica]